MRPPMPEWIIERLSRARRLWLFLDYDGTLARFAPTPDHVEPDPEVIQLVTGLAQSPHIRVGVISGRRLSHVERLMPVPGALLAGTYGVEFQTPEGQRIERLDYDVIRPPLKALRARWSDLISDRRGFFLEDKRWAVAVHAGLADDEEAEMVLSLARRVAAEPALADLFRLRTGRKFLEVAPWLADKRLTVQYLLDRYAWEGALPVYLGDDEKDEGAFRAVGARGGIAILVAAETRDTRAHWRLDSPRIVRRWLEALPALLREGKEGKRP
jgi:trehalose-phosphatase